MAEKKDIASVEDPVAAFAAAKAEGISRWMRIFETCVRERDVASARRLFAEDVVSFGTIVDRAEGLGSLIAHQWEPVWENTRGYHHVQESICVIGEPGVGDQTVTFFWRSEGFREDGEPVPRQGRASIVLRRTERNATGFEAVHSHFSMLPNGRLF